MDKIPPEYLELTREELVGAAWNLTAGSNSAVAIDRLLAVRRMESEEAGSAALVGQTQALVVATSGLGKTTARLVRATWGLVGATVALVLAELLIKLLGKS